MFTRATLYHPMWGDGGETVTKKKERKKMNELVKLLQEVLENDEVCEGFNNSNLDEDLKERIKTAIEKHSSQ